MRAINHALTGAVIGLSVTNPAVALPSALASHFVLDAIPHYGSSTEPDTELRERRFLIGLVIDAGLCGLLVLVLAISQPHNWLLAAVCAFIATLPDFAMLPGYQRARRGGQFTAPRPNIYMRFAAKIQWFEKPSGAIIELLWFAAGVSVLLTYLA